MQMIDVLKRLAELDATNPNVIPAKKLVKESTSVAECGPMGIMDSTATPTTPASLSVTAGSGEELGNMLASIMQLAGLKKVEPHDLGAEPVPSTLTSEPAMSATPKTADDDRDSMRSVLDKMHDMDDEEGNEEETDEEADKFGIPGVDTTPNDPTKPPAFEPNKFAQNSNDGDGDSSNGKRRTGMQPSATFESLMADYRKFVTESTLTESSYEEILKHYPKEVQDFQNGGDLDYDLQSALWDYHFNNGDIRNYNADASEYISQNLADFLGVDESAGAGEEDTDDELGQFVNGNRPNFNGKDEEDFDKAQQMFVNFLKKKGIMVDDINDEAFPVLVAMCQGKMCAWYDLENAHGYVAK